MTTNNNSLLREDLAALTEQLACVQAEHSLDKAALDEARELLAIAEVNKGALERELEEVRGANDKLRRDVADARRDLERARARWPGDQL